jgi:glutathione S-transferase
MELYNYFRSSASWRVRIALALKGLDYDYLPIHLVKKEQSTPEYLATSGTGLVPLLVLDDGHKLHQSMAIIEYLDETIPEPPLLPRDALGRARVRALAQDIACEIHPLNNTRVLGWLKGELGLERGGAQRLDPPLDRRRPRGRRAPARGAAVDLLPRRDARPGRLRAGAADLQRAALQVRLWTTCPT